MCLRNASKILSMRSVSIGQPALEAPSQCLGSKGSCFLTGPLRSSTQSQHYSSARSPTLGNRNQGYMSTEIEQFFSRDRSLCLVLGTKILGREWPQHPWEAMSAPLMCYLPTASTLMRRHVQHHRHHDWNSAMRRHIMVGPDSHGDRNKTDSPVREFLTDKTKARRVQSQGLTSEERQRLGCCEYRALRVLSIIVPVYSFLWQLLGCFALGAWINHNPRIHRSKMPTIHGGWAFLTECRRLTTLG